MATQYTTSAKKHWDWAVVLDNDRVRVEHQWNSGINNHYRISVKGDRWERHYIREMDHGRDYEKAALELICEIVAR